MPDFPEGLEYLWEHFLKLTRRRQAGMASNPLTYEAVEAYERKALVRLSAWETDLIMRIDDAVLAAGAGNQKAAPKADAPTEPVPVENVRGIKAMFRGLATLKKQQLGKGDAHG